MSEIKLGDKVKCIHSGYTGIAVAKTEFINGCIQFEVMPKVNKKNEMPDGMNIDQHSLKVIKPKRKKRGTYNTGGPMTRVKYGRY